MLVGLLGLLVACSGEESVRSPPTPYDPLAYARERRGLVDNPEAAVPPQCYTATRGVANPCWACHVVGKPPNHLVDWELQQEYAFSDAALTNHWTNLWVERGSFVATTDAAAVTAWIRADNYAPLRAALAERRDFPGWTPDLDLAAGFDPEGFARDGTRWRALRYQPFPGTFWPTNGATDDVYVRLPAALAPDRPTEIANFAILEANLTGRGEVAPVWLGSGEPVQPGVYPLGTEFLHTVRYVDLDAAGALSARMKEVRYSKKVQALDRWGFVDAYRIEAEEKDEGKLPVYRGEAEVGLRNAYGWQYQGWIEDAEGRLRLQTDEEHRTCMGCHGGLGVTVDSSFAFPRKLPGAEGWAVQELRGQTDRPQRGHRRGEVATWLERTGGGDELRSNDEMAARYFVDGALDPARLPTDLADLLLPSPERAHALNAAWMGLVADQSYTHGRVALPAPAVNVFKAIENGDTELGKAGKVYADGTLLLE